MKKLYGLMGFAGFMITVGGAGGADTVSFGTAFSVMTLGLSLLLLSLLLVKSHNMRMRKKRYVSMKRKTEYVNNTDKCCIAVRRKTPSGISSIISEKINSPELC